MRAILALLLAVPLGACATTSGAGPAADNDPYEGFNRSVWGFNRAVDKVALKPAATVYRTVTPVPARRGLGRVFANLAEPFSFINSLLQGRPDRAFNALGRFVINTTIGVGGLADHASDLGLPPTPEDFGQTLAVRGARKSPYLVLPILGPSTVRDAVGTAVRFAADPAQILIDSELTRTQNAGVTAARVIDGRAQASETGADAFLKTSADPYAAARSAYLQRRAAEIANEETEPRLESTPTDEDDLLGKALKEDSIAPAPEEPSKPPVETPEDSPLSD
ncbi:MAG TPA: VacJ family lipoprotein [Allosphingosinicella sp.]